MGVVKNFRRRTIQKERGFGAIEVISILAARIVGCGFSPRDGSGGLKLRKKFVVFSMREFETL